MLKRWEDLPEFMKTDEVRPYYETLKKKKISLALKRIMDFVGGIILLVLLALPMLFVAIWIKLDSKGPVSIGRRELQHMENILKFINSEQWLVMLIRLDQL